MNEIQAQPLAESSCQRSQVNAEAAAYVAPRLQVLGAWQSVTLVYSVPIGPGTKNLFAPDKPTY